MYRLFVAIDLPEQVKNSIREICSGLPEARWVDVKQLHLTLRFIGDADDGLFAAIKESLAGVSENAFSLTLQGVGCFPPKKAPRVLWVGINRNDTLIRLADKVEQSLTGVGLQPEQRSFSPHITIARFRDISPHKAADYLAKNTVFKTEAFPVEEFYLYSSALTQKGAVHRREATYPLKGGFEF